MNPLPEQTSPPMWRAGAAVGSGVAASLACVLPATMRVATVVANTEGTTRVWVALSAIALGPMVASVIVLRRAVDALRTFAGPRAELRAYGVALWFAALVILLSELASVLRANTHHHALAGVTFACGALALALFLGAVCARVVALLESARPNARRTAAATIALVVALALAWVGVRFLRAASRDAASAGAATLVVDVLTFALSAGFAARPSLAAQRPLALAGPPIALAVIALGVSSLRDAPLRTAIDDHAPAFSPVVDALPGP